MAKTFSITKGGGGAPTTSQYVTLALDSALSAERVLTGTTNQIILTDGGANGNITLSTPQNINTGATPTFASMRTTAGYYYGSSTSFPMNLEVSRTLPATVADYVDIGTFTLANGAHNVRISATGSISGYSIAKQWVVACYYNQTSNTWQTVLPLTDSGIFGGGNFDLIVNSNANDMSLRLFKTIGSQTGTITIRIESVGDTTDSFTASSSTGSMSTPTATFSSNSSIRAAGLLLDRAIPTTVNNYREIGYFVVSNGPHSFRVNLTINSVGFSVAKSYLITSFYNMTSNTWTIARPISDTGSYNGEDFELLVNGDGANCILRILRTAGTTAGSIGVFIESTGKAADVFIEQSGTSSMSAPTTYLPTALISQSAGSVTSVADFKMTEVGNGLYIKEGTDATMGYEAGMSGGTVTVNTTKVTASSRIFLTMVTNTGGTTGSIFVASVSAGTSFTVNSTDGRDTEFNWLIVEPA